MACRRTKAFAAGTTKRRKPEVELVVEAPLDVEALVVDILVPVEDVDREPVPVEDICGVVLFDMEYSTELVPLLTGAVPVEDIFDVVLLVTE